MANEYLKRTPTSNGNRKVWTWAAWVKRNSEGSTVGIFGANGGSNDTDLWEAFFASGNNLGIQGNNTTWKRTTRLFRGPSSWCHIVIAYNSTLSAASDRYKIFVNGKQETEFNTENNPSINALNGINQVATHIIGARTSSNDYNKAQFNDVFLVDGQALTPDVFGFYKDGDGYMSSGTTQATDFRPGQWMPHSPRKIKKDINRRGGFGVNGFYLPMNDSSNPGADFHCAPNSIIKLKGEDLPQPRNGAPTTSDAYVSQLREETGELGFDGAVKFDGSDYLSLPYSSDLNLSNNDFTIEFWLYPDGPFDANDNGLIAFGDNNAGYGKRELLFNGYTGDGGTALRLIGSSDGTNTDIFSFEKVGNATLYKWQHLALVRNGSNFNVYKDGVSIFSKQISATFNAQTSEGLVIGNYKNSGNAFSSSLHGYLSNVRVVIGSALYTSNFTPPTEPLTNVTNTKLLCCNSSTSATAAAVIPTGTISVSGDPFATRNELTGSIVYALPLISGGKNSGFGDYSNDIRGSGTAKTVSAVTYNSITPTITSGHSPYGSFVDYNSPANTGGYIEVADSTAFDNIHLTSSEWTFEAWYKRGAIGSGASNLIQFGNETDYQNIGISIHPSGRLYYVWSYNGSTWGVLSSSDGPVIPLDEWCHIAIVKESYEVTPTPRIVTYVNGVAAKSVNVAGNMSYTSPNYMRIGGHYSGTSGGGDTYFYNGGIFDARFYSIVKYKGGFDVPRHYAPVGIEAFRTTADTCKNNFATFNPIARGSKYGLVDGNLSFTNSAGNWDGFIGTTHGFRTGKWYWESRVNVSTSYHILGIMDNEIKPHNISNSYFYGMTYQSDGRFYAENNGNGNNFSTSNTPAQTVGDIVRFAVDMDAKKMWIGINGTWLNSGNPSTGANANWNSSVGFTDGHYYTPVFISYSSAGMTANFGQNSSFCGQTTAGTNADDSGKGLFKYEPPTGFLALCTDNLPTPAIADPGKHFKTVLWTGSATSANRAMTGLGFTPDLVWSKTRNHAYHNVLMDSVRGPSNRLNSDQNYEENYTAGGHLASFDDGGFTWQHGSGSGNQWWNESGKQYVAWCWKAGGPAVTNNDGQIESQVSVNHTAGFSIVSYTGTGNSATVGHGLTKAPSFIILKNRDTTTNWPIYHKSTSNLGNSAQDVVYLDLSIISGSSDNIRNVNDTTIELVNWSGVTGDGNEHIAYCWAEIEGFSKFGSYVGNGDPDGPFVYCGHKPAWVLLKKINGQHNENWRLFDSSRCPTNQNNKHLIPSADAGETIETGIDLLSNGFKLRHADGHQNQSGSTYIYASFAESPFQTANAK